LLLMGLAGVPAGAGSARRWVARWGTSVLTALLPLLPTWYVLARAAATPGYLPGVGSSPAAPSGIDSARFVGYVDPYLFGPRDVWLSPLPALRLEIVILFTAGLAVLFLAGRALLGPRVVPLRAFLIGGIVTTVGLLGVEWAGSAGGPVGDLAKVVSESETSMWLFTLYALIATLPLVLSLEWAIRRNRPALPSAAAARPSRPWRLDGPTPGASAVPVVLALAIVVPGAVLTPTQLPPVLSTLYADFGNVTVDDFALLEYAGGHLPPAARVLVAPGSAGEFLPAYDPNAVVLFPMYPDAVETNVTYGLLVSALTNGTLNRSAMEALVSLDVQYVLVTPANTILWPPFSAQPFLADDFPVLFVQGGDYLFQTPTDGPPG
jgi:hypothetical protein